jgi:hypothetical protein
MIGSVNRSASRRGTAGRAAGRRILIASGMTFDYNRCLIIIIYFYHYGICTSQGEARWTRPWLYVCPMLVSPPACVVISRSKVGIAGTIASAHDAGSNSTASLLKKSAMRPRPVGVSRRTPRGPWPMPPPHRAPAWETSPVGNNGRGSAGTVLHPSGKGPPRTRADDAIGERPCGGFAAAPRPLAWRAGFDGRWH